MIRALNWTYHIYQVLPAVAAEKGFVSRAEEWVDGVGPDRGEGCGGRGRQW